MRSLGWALIQYHSCPYKREDLRHRDRHVQKADDVKTQRECHIQARDAQGY